jgi:transposase InsO family protein
LQLLDKTKLHRHNQLSTHIEHAVAEQSVPSERVIRSLSQIIEWRATPKTLRCDNKPEYISKILQDWARREGIEVAYIQPGNPQHYAYMIGWHKSYFKPLKKCRKPPRNGSGFTTRNGLIWPLVV